MAKMPQKVMDMFNDPQASKALATIDAAGNLNVVPKATLSAIDAETIVYANVYEGKSSANIETTKKVAATAFKRQIPEPPGFCGYQVKGTFQGWQTSGPLFDQFAKQVSTALQLPVKGIAMIKVEEVYSATPPETGKRLA